MNQLQIFKNSQLGEIRVVQSDNGEPLFCLADLCKALDLRPSKVRQRLEDGVVSTQPIEDSLGRTQQANFVNEDGLYDVILNSRKPEAKHFRKWVTSEVLPSIMESSHALAGESSEKVLNKPDTTIQSITNINKMESLVLTNSSGKDVTTSLIVAKVFGKMHKHVLRDIENLSCSQDFRETNFGLCSYLSMQGKEMPMYEMTKDGFSFLVMGYTGDKAGAFKEAFIQEFNKRDVLLKDDHYIVERAMAILAKKTKELEAKVELQSQVIKQAAPKVKYFDGVMNSVTLIPTTIIAKELGMSAITLNRILHKQGVQHKVNGTWVLYEKYQDKGYTGTRTHKYYDLQGCERTVVNTYWTERGRFFIHNLMRKIGKGVDISGLKVDVKSAEVKIGFE